MRLFSESEFFDQRTITADVFLSQIAEKTASLADHLQKTASGVVILRILLQMLGELHNSRGQNRDLYFR